MLCSNIIAFYKGDYLDQMLSVNEELKAGKTIAEMSLPDHNNIQLNANPEWLSGNSIKGTSIDLEQ